MEVRAAGEVGARPTRRFGDGSQSLRFCYYDRKGRFQRSPLIVSEDLIPALRASLRASPRLSRLLKRVVG